MSIRVGQYYELKHKFSKSEVKKFAEISQDFNPLHLDEEYAKKTIFGKCIVHGMLVASLFSGILGSKFPGIGTIYLSQTLNFLKPIFLDEDITIRIEIIELREDKPIAKLKTICLNSKAELAVDGVAVVKYRDN